MRTTAFWWMARPGRPWLAYFQAGQFYAYSREGNAFDEMRDAGDLGLIQDSQLRSQLAFYYESNANRMADIMLHEPGPAIPAGHPQRPPMPCSCYIWAHCFRILPGSARDQRLIDRRSPLGTPEAAATSWPVMGDFRICRANCGSGCPVTRRRVELARTIGGMRLQLKDRLEAELGR